jgi:hypothetical protein
MKATMSMGPRRWQSSADVGRGRGGHEERLPMRPSRYFIDTGRLDSSLRLWWARSFRLPPNSTFQVDEVIVAGDYWRPASSSGCASTRRSRTALRQRVHAETSTCGGRGSPKSIPRGPPPPYGAGVTAHGSMRDEILISEPRIPCARPVDASAGGFRILERYRRRRFTARRRRSPARPHRCLTGQALGLVVMISAQAGPAWVWRSIQRPISIFRSDADRHLWAGKSTRGLRSAAAGRR